MTNVTNITNADVLSQLAEGFSPLGTDVIGINAAMGGPVILGLLILFGLTGLLLFRRASMEVYAITLLPTIILLAQFGLLPSALGVMALAIAGVIIAWAFISFITRR